MLAKTPKAPDFSTLLKIPEKPAAIVDADAAWHQAVAEREAAQARHVEAVRQYRAQVPGQPPVVTLREVDEAGAALGPLFQAEQLAADERDRLRAEFETETSAALTDGLAKLNGAILEKLNELEELLALGSGLLPASFAAGIKLPNHLPNYCRDITGSLVSPARARLRTRF